MDDPTALAWEAAAARSDRLRQGSPGKGHARPCCDGRFGGEGASGQKLKGERPDIGDCMKRISLEWQELPETAKAKYSSAAVYGRVPFAAVRPI
jgi:hypothetical protein